MEDFLRYYHEGIESVLEDVQLVKLEYLLLEGGGDENGQTRQKLGRKEEREKTGSRVQLSMFALSLCTDILWHVWTICEFHSFTVYFQN